MYLPEIKLTLHQKFRIPFIVREVQHEQKS